MYELGFRVRDCKVGNGFGVVEAASQHCCVQRSYGGLRGPMAGCLSPLGGLMGGSK